MIYSGNTDKQQLKTDLDFEFCHSNEEIKYDFLQMVQNRNLTTFLIEKLVLEADRSMSMPRFSLTAANVKKVHAM